MRYPDRVPHFASAFLQKSAPDSIMEADEQLQRRVCSGRIRRYYVRVNTNTA